MLKLDKKLWIGNNIYIINLAYILWLDTYLIIKKNKMQFLCFINFVDCIFNETNNIRGGC